MINYSRIAEAIESLKNIYNEDPQGFENWKQQQTDKMHPLMAEEDPTVYVFELSDLEWYDTYEVDNEWDAESDVWNNMEFLRALSARGIEVDYIEGTEGSGDEAFYVRFV